MTTSSQLRRYPRIGLPRGMFVAWQGTGNRVVSRVQTLGLGGLFIETLEPPGVGEVLRLYFQIPGGDVRARGVVRASYAGKGMGVEFTAMAPETRARLHKLVNKLTAPLGD